MMMHRFQIRESHRPVNTLRTYLTDPRRSGVAANWVVMFCKLLSNPSWVWINTYKNTILMGWTSIYQLFWCELQGYKVLIHCQLGMEKKWSNTSWIGCSMVFTQFYSSVLDIRKFFPVELELMFQLVLCTMFSMVVLLSWIHMSATCLQVLFGRRWRSKLNLPSFNLTRLGNPTLKYPFKIIVQYYPFMLILFPCSQGFSHGFSPAMFFPSPRIHPKFSD